jgi:hypothetical protein
MMRIWILVALPMMLMACGGSAKRSHDLQYDVRAFNEGVRWVKLPQAAIRILPSQREAFLDKREALEEELRIDDFEIMRLKMEGKGQEFANVQIKWTWHMDRQGIVRKTTSRQKWRRYGSRWIMFSEVHVRGHEMPGIDPKKDSDEENEKSGEKSNDFDDAQEGADEGPEKSVTMHPRERDYRRIEANLRVAEKGTRTAE